MRNRDDAALAHTLGASEHFTDVAGGVRLHHVEAGPGDGPLLVLLHGFPEFWFAWRAQIPVLAAAGYRVVAPDLRGYNLSSKPEGIANYRLDRLSADIAHLIRAVAGENGRAACVAGHDWGGAVAWDLGSRFPECVERLAILNAPHPTRFVEKFLTPTQFARSWYMLAFQLPLVPEAMFEANDYALLRHVFATAPVPPFPPEVREAYVRAFRDHPGSLTAAMNYYRAALQSPTMDLVARPIEAPVLVLWGEQDAHLARDLAVPPRRKVPSAETFFLPGTHWVHSDAATAVTAHLLRFAARR